MKKILIKFCVLFFIAIAVVNFAEAQFVIKVRPAPVVVKARPAAPSRDYVWVEGDWVWQGNNYIYKEGYWARPAFRGANWIPGHWKYHRRRGGWFWVPGHWNRR